MRLVSLSKRPREFPHLFYEVRTGKKMTIYEPRSERSPDTSFAVLSSWTFQPPELEEIGFLLFMSLSVHRVLFKQTKTLINALKERNAMI